jgi:O-antigen/teichoic acid export membrane protein
MNEDNYGHILKYTGIFGGVQGLNILIGLVRNKIVAMLLGPSGMGLSALFGSTVNFISQATNLGISFSAVRHVSELFDHGDEERIAHFVKVVRAWSLLTALFGMLVCIVAGPWLSSSTFSWGDHTLHFIFLAPAVGLLAITGGETAILKGARRLKALAVIQLFSVFAALLISLPVYFYFGESGIVPVIVLMAMFTMHITIRYSYQLYPLRLQGANGILGEGMEMVRLGVAFVLAGILGSGVEMLIRSYLNLQGDLQAVGLYNAGYMITVTYAGMVFSAMETDYFPRLSAIHNDVATANLTVNRQIEVSVLIVSPMLAMLIVALPMLIPLLYTTDFLPMVPMAQVAVFAMYLKAISLPISYMSLAKGDSLSYLLLETISDVAVVTLIIYGYSHWELFGTGLALSAAYLVDLAVVFTYTRFRYGYRMSSSVLQYISIQLPLGVAVYLTTLIDSPAVGWPMSLLLCFVSIVVSVHILRQKTSLWDALTAKFKARFRKNG